MAKKNEYVVVRAKDAGCWAGTLVSYQGREVILTDARRLWYWDGAATLSQLAIDGPQKPENCKFPEAVGKVQLLDACEIIFATKKAEEAIKAVQIWKQ